MYLRKAILYSKEKNFIYRCKIFLLVLQRKKWLPVRVDVNDSYSLLLTKGLAKWKPYHEELFDEDEEYSLCYENGNETIVWCQEIMSFNSKKYHIESGKDYNRIYSVIWHWKIRVSNEASRMTAVRKKKKKLKGEKLWIMKGLHH